MSLQISMVLFSEAPALSAVNIQSALARQWPGLGAATELSGDESTVSFRLEAAEVVIGLMPAPFPWSDLEGPCATSVLWPGAAAALREHQQHAIVTVFGELSPLELSLLLTKVTTALMASAPEALGVFWSNAALLIPKDLFIEAAIELIPLGPPLVLWVDCRVGWTQEPTRSAGFTTGLAELGLMELEAPDATESPVELRKRFESVSQYLLEKGMVIRDGDTLGESAEEKIRVVYAESSFGAKNKVMRLVYCSDTNKKAWWKFW